jgi:hypothetical protein
VLNIAKKIGVTVFIAAWIFISGEIVIRVMASFIPIYDVEMMHYSKELKTRSLLPGVSHQHKPNASARLMGVDVVLNSLGHRNADLTSPKGKHEKRIHFIGSSILLGWGVPAKDGFAESVATLLNENKPATNPTKFISINAGVGNFNTVYEVALLKSQINKTDPDLIVLQYHINDAEPNPAGTDSLFLQYSEFAAFLYLHFRSMSAVATQTLAEHYQSLYLDDSPSWKRTKAALVELKELSVQHNIPMLAVLVPDLHDLTHDGPYPPLYKQLKKAFEKIGIDLIDLFPALQEKFSVRPMDAWVYRDDPHPSRLAHKVIAEQIFSRIV